MKQLTAIGFALLLAWLQIAPTRVMALTPSPTCSETSDAACSDCCKGMACCAAQPTPHSPPVSATPDQFSIHSQIALLASAVVAWILPQESAKLSPSVSLIHIAAATAPLYARHCALLL